MERKEESKRKEENQKLLGRERARLGKVRSGRGKAKNIEVEGGKWR